MYKPLNIGLHCVQNMGATVAMAKLDTNVSCIINRVGQNHIHTVYIRYFWQGNHLISVIYGVYIRFWPTLIIQQLHCQFASHTQVPMRSYVHTDPAMPTHIPYTWMIKPSLHTIAHMHTPNFLTLKLAGTVSICIQDAWCVR
jgi:hypothetical protein